MIRVAVVGLGKMGISHLAIVNAHPDVTVAAVCDPLGYMIDVLEKYSGLRGYTDLTKMLNDVQLDAVIISTPSRFHASQVQQVLDAGLHVFCEKPFCLDPAQSRRLSDLAVSKTLVNQVGYHYRFVSAFEEMKRLIDMKAIGTVTHVLAEAYGPVVLKPKGSTWRTQSSEGGGCLYDYAAHPLNLLNWFFGEPREVAGSVLGKIFSRDTDDEVYSTLLFDNDVSAQLSVSWSDESFRKMSTKITISGSNGKIIADRQECQTYLRHVPERLSSYKPGWTINYVTDLQTPVWFYVRGEEYSAQIAYFVDKVKNKDLDNVNSFAEAARTDRLIDMIRSNALAKTIRPLPQQIQRRRPNLLGFLKTQF
jgi:predicted dehydrogenase